MKIITSKARIAGSVLRQVRRNTSSASLPPRPACDSSAGTGSSRTSVKPAGKQQGDAVRQALKSTHMQAAASGKRVPHHRRVAAPPLPRSVQKLPLPPPPLTSRQQQIFIHLLSHRPGRARLLVVVEGEGQAGERGAGRQQPRPRRRPVCPHVWMQRAAWERRERTRQLGCSRPWVM